VQNDTDVLEIPEEPRKRPRLGLDSALREDDRVSACTSKVPSSNRGPPVQDHSSDSGADECIICMDPIMSHGDHRAACLICGHIFGQKCIEKWVKSTDKEKRVCPQCKTPAKLADIRTLFTSKQVLCVVDNSEMDGVRKDLIAARKELNAVKEQLLVFTFS
jgi:E3 ubiquitin-protein ligase RFWD3